MTRTERLERTRLLTEAQLTQLVADIDKRDVLQHDDNVFFERLPNGEQRPFNPLGEDETLLPLMNKYMVARRYDGVEWAYTAEKAGDFMTPMEFKVASGIANNLGLGTCSAIVYRHISEHTLRNLTQLQP